MLITQIGAVAREGSSFVATFIRSTPSLEKMGVIVGYANMAQQRHQRTRFEILAAGHGALLFRPKDAATDIPPQVLYEHLAHFLVEVGFMPEDQRPRPKPDTPVKTRTNRQRPAQATA